MKKFFTALMIFVAAFCGGVFAQSIGGGKIIPALAQTVVPQFLNFTQQGSGTQTQPSGMLHTGFSYNDFFINNDNINASAYTGVYGLTVELDSSGSNSFGHKTALSGVMRLSGSVPAQSATAQDYIGVNALSQGDVNVGGTSASDADARGAIFGIGANAILNNGATFYRNLTGMEIDVKAVAGSSVRKKSGISIATLGSGNNVKGSIYDTALSISAQSGGSVVWDTGILFSDYNGIQPIETTGTIIKTSGSSTVTDGIDFTSYTFTGAPIKVPLMTPASSSDTCTVGSAKWDTSFIYICTATNTWKRATLSAF